ncbi:MAG: glycosyltransferase, partial [Planctomycetota bacterium]|nr:glycosyltransferase [Planctomycetota bacterium]
APRRDWSIGKYVRLMGAWIAERAREVDLIYLDSPREELLATIDATADRQTAVLVQCLSSDYPSDTRWWQHNRNGKRCLSAVNRAHGIILDHASIEKELIILGVDRPKMFRIPIGIQRSLAINSVERWETRKVLAQANSDLSTEPDTPVVLCQAAMTELGGVNRLVQVARMLLLRFPNLRIWLVGDGPLRDNIYNSLRAEGVRASVAIPGSFSDPSDVFRAADCFFQPSDVGLNFFLPMAISMELPIVSVDSVQIRRSLDAACEDAEGAVQARHVSSDLGRPGDPVHPSLLSGNSEEPSEFLAWCDANSPKSIQESMISVLTAMPQAKLRAQKLRELMMKRRSENHCLDALTAAIHRLSTNPL